MEASTFPTTPCFFCLIFFNDKMFVRNNRVDFSLNPGYSVGSLRGSGTQQFRQLTKQVLFTSAPVAACNAFHTQEKDQRGREHTAGEWMSQVGCLFKPRREQICVTPRSAFRSIYTHASLRASGKKLYAGSSESIEQDVDVCLATTFCLVIRWTQLNVFDPNCLIHLFI